MKKILMILAVILFGAVSAMAIKLPFDKYTIDRDELPKEAQEMLTEHFPKAKVSMIKVDKHLLKKPDYDVKLTNGTKIEFNSNGQWKKVDCGKREIPSSLIHKTVKRHLSNNFPDVKAVSIKKDLSGFEITTADKRILKYDRLGIYKGEKTDDSADENDSEENAETVAEADT